MKCNMRMATESSGSNNVCPWQCDALLAHTACRARQVPMDRILREMTQGTGGVMQQGGAAQGQGQAKGTSATSPLCDAQVLLSLHPNVSRPLSGFVTLRSVWKSA